MAGDGTGFGRAVSSPGARQALLVVFCRAGMCASVPELEAAYVRGELKDVTPQEFAGWRLRYHEWRLARMTVEAQLRARHYEC